ncbi:MAG: type 1 glutamine amidotransferase [Deltaproteobacteria bacterium]|nr:type 1 glutamine amidotransferase [Deltaproteobacteria bacterium]
MSSAQRFLIVDGYPKQSRDELQEAGMKLAWELYRDLLLAHLPDSEFDVLLPSDPGTGLPEGVGLEQYNGVIWTGCNLTIYHPDDQRVLRQIELARQSYEKGVPAFGSCWGIQIAVTAAGGEVRANPKGREMGVARKIHLTEQGSAHPMFLDKPRVFDGFISHVDEVTSLPRGARWLATNEFTRIQAVEVVHKKGVFWATQYHPEYNLHEMARLLVARTPKLLKEGFFESGQDAQNYVSDMETLARTPGRKDLRWRLGLDNHILDDRIRRTEFRNWIEQVVKP